MKGLILIVLVLLTSSTFLAQDTLVFHTGEIKCVKIFDVGLEIIKYKNCTNLNGPFYTVNQTQINLVKYSTGEIDTISFINDEFIQLIPKIEISPPDIARVKMHYEGKRLGERAFGELLRNYPEPNKRQLLLIKYEEYKNGKQIMNKNRTVGIFCFVISGVFLIGAGSAWNNDVNQTPTLIGAGISGLVGLGFILAGGKNGKTQTKLKREIVTMYNN